MADVSHLPIMSKTTLKIAKTHKGKLIDSPRLLKRLFRQKQIRKIKPSFLPGSLNPCWKKKQA